MTAITFREANGYVDCDGARLDRAQCEELLSIWQSEHDCLLRIGSIEATCWARRIRKTWLALSFTASVVWPQNVEAEPKPQNLTVRALNPRRWAATPYATGD